MRERDRFATLSGGAAGPPKGLSRRLAPPEPGPEVAGEVCAGEVGHIKPRADHVARTRLHEGAKDAGVWGCRRRRLRRTWAGVAAGPEGKPAAGVQKHDHRAPVGTQARQRGRVERTVGEPQAKACIRVSGVVEAEGAATQPRKFDAPQAAEARVGGDRINAV